jgi:cellulose biosynthesis protein BcsQ
VSIPALTFFNSQGGMGKTALVYHLAWMFAELGVTVLAVDCDPQANLTAAFLDDAMLASLWDAGENGTIFQAILDSDREKQFLITDHKARQIAPRLHLIAGDPGLASQDEQLHEQWTKALSKNSAERGRAMLALSAFWRVAQTAGAQVGAQLILFDTSPYLSAINRSILIGSDCVLASLSADYFSLQGLRNLGPSLEKWRKGWSERCQRLGSAEAIPAGHARPIGYVVLQNQARLLRPVQAQASWLQRIPGEYRKQLLGGGGAKNAIPTLENDDDCLACLRHYVSLAPLAQEARKPIFKLRSADGAIGSHAASVARAYKDFNDLAHKILERIGISASAFS